MRTLPATMAVLDVWYHRSMSAVRVRVCEKSDVNQKQLYVIDVDGTVANIDHRTHLITGEKQDWKAFFNPRLMMKDEAIEAARPHFKDGVFIHGKFIFLTARVESTRLVTQRWLIRNGFATANTRMLMKPDFMRKQRSKVFKPSVFQTLHVDHPDYDLILIEDYGEVIRAVDELGFVRTCKAPDCWTSW